MLVKINRVVTIILVAVITLGTTLTVVASVFAAATQPTIFVGTINITPYTRTEFVERRGDGVIIFDGRTYTAEDFFDAHHGMYFGIYSAFAGNNHRHAEIRVRLHNDDVIEQITHRQPSSLAPGSVTQPTPTPTPQPIHTPTPTPAPVPHPTFQPTPQPTPTSQTLPTTPSDQVRIRLDGQFIDTGDQPPVIVDNRTLVPFRAVMEELGFDEMLS